MPYIHLQYPEFNAVVQIPEMKTQATLLLQAKKQALLKHNGCKLSVNVSVE